MYIQPTHLHIMTLMHAHAQASTHASERYADPRSSLLTCHVQTCPSSNLVCLGEFAQIIRSISSYTALMLVRLPVSVYRAHEKLFASFPVVPLQHACHGDAHRNGGDLYCSASVSRRASHFHLRVIELLHRARSGLGPIWAYKARMGP